MTFPGPLLVSPIVSTQWLADHLGSDNLVIIDASVVITQLPDGLAQPVPALEDFDTAGHVPGAVFADLVHKFSDPQSALAFTKPSVEQFARAAGELGVSSESTVVVYDTTVGQWAARLWWLLRAFGLDSVAVLDGGFSKWTAESRETAHGKSESEPREFEATPRPELWVDKAFVERVVAGSETAALVCALPAHEFSGEADSRERLGHIPGSMSAPAGGLVDHSSNAFLPEASLRATFAPVLSEPLVIAYCAAGIAAASDALALTLLGHRNVAIYDGSLSEWASDVSAPLATDTVTA
jgi:thiosulfate/3-mercaptopyruvate sulfurtransferase